MKKCLFVFLASLLVVGCQSKAESSEFSLGNIYPSELKNKQHYFLVVPFEWSGKEGTELDSLHILNNNDERTAMNANFYIGAETKKTGVYRRDKIGEKQDVQGYRLSEHQTLIMELNVNEELNSAERLKFVYEVDGKQEQKVINWDTLQELKNDE
ncbi:hypothetical protein [Thalassobacillus sp. CUG 92003]|uniref:hypothetical protein n=1 Tax=Thalassobacillus sp. CUG 92003 TaxID=2736641 RepID=UPI0015E6D274|nr:hypothetical protein [Thalassobacillus sp. CUG 92003]